MFFNFLKTSFRSFSKNKMHSIINFTGLTIGLACFALILKFVLHENSFDNFHENKENLYRLTANGFAKIPDLWAPGLKESMPEVEKFTRLQLMGPQLFEHEGNKTYEQNGLFADSTFFSVLSFNLLQGNAGKALSKRRSMVLTKSFAQKFFGNSNPIGKTLTIVYNAKPEPYEITGIAADPPPNSHITFNYLVSMSSNDAEWVNDWKWNQFYTYLVLSDGTQITQLESKISDWLKTKIDDENYLESVMLQKVEDIYLTSNLEREMGRTRDASILYIFSAIALFILSIAIINFTNLNTARAFTRVKEVGVRKTNGASRNSILSRFVGESLLMSILSLIAALILVELFIQDFNRLLSTSLSSNFTEDVSVPVIMILISVLSGVLGSLFPAFYLSSLDPSSVMKGVTLSSGKTIVRKLLVGFQFAVSAVLIVGAMVVSSQLDFIQSKDLGFQKDQQLILRIQNTAMRNNADIIKERLLNHPAVLSASVSSNIPGGSDYGIPYVAEGLTDDERPSCRVLAVDDEFIDTYNIEIIEGRNFSDEFATDDLGWLISESAAKQFKWEQPIGKRLSMPVVGRDWGNIVGIVKDFHYRNLHEKIEPLLLMKVPDKGWRSYFTIKFDPNQTNEVLSHAETVWNEYDAVNPFTYFFLDDLFAQQYETDKRDGLLINIFTAVAMFVACLGLFGLTSFTLIRKTKEIGVRKVLGATSGRIYWEVLHEFFMIVAIANIIALPAAYYFIEKWLSNFAYRTAIEIGVFVFAVLIGFMMVLFSTAVQTYRASNLNPSDALRHE